MVQPSDILRCKFALIRFIEAAIRAGIDRDLGVALIAWHDELYAELKRLRTGARARTLDDAARIEQLDRELCELNADDRLAVLMDRTGFKRTKIYRLRALARRPGKNGIPDLNGTRVE
jgi:predicted DNA-binding transcriptional regulator AlpA